MLLMALGAMLVEARRLIGLTAAEVGSDALAVVKDLDHARRGANLDPFAGEGVRDTVKMAVELDVVVDVDARLSPVMQLKAFGGERRQRGPIQFGKQRGPRARPLAKRPLVELFH